MPYCLACGSYLFRGYICPSHAANFVSEWAQENKIWNDFFMRGIEPKRLPKEEREAP